MKRRWWLCGLAISGCVQIEGVGPAGAEGDEVPPRVQAVFDAQCAVAGCHDATTRAGSLSLAATDTAALLSGASANQEPSLALVERGSVADSYLAIKLLAEAPAGRSRQGERMPLGGTSNPDDIALVIGWIAGAEVDGDAMSDADGSNDADGAGSSDGDESSGSIDMGGTCGVEALASSGIAQIDAGPGEAQIPEVIGDVLFTNCGCHLAQELVPEAQAFQYDLPFDLTSLEGWRGIANGREAAAVVRERVVEQATMPPAYACDDGSGDAMAPGDRDLLAEWVAAGLPGGEAWP